MPDANIYPTKYREFGEAGKALPIDGARYLEKIIQIQFQIPPIEASDMALVGRVGDLLPG